MNIQIRPIRQLELSDLQRVISGYTADSRYVIRRNESEDRVTFELTLEPLPAPYVKRYDPIDADALQLYAPAAAAGTSFGAYDGGTLAGIIITEVRRWNSSLWVWEFHVAEGYRRHGIGRRLMECALDTARHAGLRTIICETQNTNVPAIRAYRHLGFQMEGVDISYYTNQDYPDGEMAVFMKRRLD